MGDSAQRYRLEPNLVVLVNGFSKGEYLRWRTWADSIPILRPLMQRPMQSIAMFCDAEQITDPMILYDKTIRPDSKLILALWKCRFILNLANLTFQLQRKLTR